MNYVFYGNYPDNWSWAKMFVIHKKGPTLDPNNYRGISIASMLPKLFDGILNSRFNTWYRPCLEQAGAQSGRGCAEQLLTLRLYIDIAKRQRKTLYVLFVDYIKAYDKLNRQKLLNMLADHGCGDSFLRALGNSLINTQNSIGNESFQSTIGVKQGSSISCALFTFYLDHTVRAVRSFGPDGFLQESHLLLLMDDTVLLATSREAMTRKLQLLYDSAKDINMVVHPNKSQYLVINSNDRDPFAVEDVTISHTEKYCYLGSPILASTVAKHVEEHAKLKQGHVYKYISFVHKNQDAPFKVKKQVLQAAVNSVLLYACESWLTDNVKCIEAAVLKCLKVCLGVRSQTSSDLVYIETGSIPMAYEIRIRQKKFINKKSQRADFRDLPVGLALHRAAEANSPMGKYFVNLMNSHEDEESAIMDSIKTRVSSSVTTRMTTYTSINTDLAVHRVYDSLAIPEVARISLSMMRLSSHYLHIETGRWSRLPQERRTCICGGVQTEHHVLLHCPVTEDLRVKYTVNVNDMQALMNSEIVELARYCHAVLKRMNNNY